MRKGCGGLGIGAAAIADYRPATEAEQKIKKFADDLTIELAKTTDILEAARGNFVKVGSPPRPRT